ncbi:MULTISPECIES: FKBP-type peptidyl-prolyl cis-trans isomerase [Methylophaga]|jgi:FKBP-type peptidyl-prolyl cis-trans isomerase SlyD|uniref:Peptidyl-prolyl cis-trans isomerase n=1 Tax=Methylophaga nitratireducenticrescens TaxID=754476 RepID=I1XKG3_METNJ|nr:MULTISPECIES: peptidylprolyl isomerase [Methylophaga]AFI84882.1 peptidylprolyl isomerase [Methylophaga nitratireducenticrescens]AUZ84896.1 peptidylprolyl isomerase [Methylophaga nitratireducenticrescens]MAL49534.1 peptidylprolyl isomerase [Methylophaga sp.]MAP25714.1 peptidylprolyl isomerase [Methylophaga sp.]MBL1458256.1 peptidylprolyl isomerase [Methylophaga sp.]|tara:strand:+ start:2894 stop:3376 length:483 start_codon:yes stop_codon:yes gene_type:complete
MKVADNKVVVIDYTLTDNSGTVIDSSEGAGPLAYLHGAGNIIPGLEDALAGKETGDKVQASIEPANAYGERHDALKQDVPAELFSGVEKVEVGMQFQSETEQGPVLVTVVAINDETVTVDGNHPLAGVHLNFDVEIREVREPSAEELEHGHVHGEGGHQH